MSSPNLYKPRYKLAYQTKSKIWPYKNSYLRGFYLIRSKWIKFKTWKFKKYAIVAKNIKWHEARNFFNPNIKKLPNKFIFGKKTYGRPKALFKRYVSLFHIKQKLRQFHGKLTENKFRIRFKTHKTNVASNSNSFFVNLESRLDLIFFRIRLLPTVFACHQFIIYNGLEINSKLEKSPSYQLKIGEIVSVPKTSWVVFYSKVFKRVYFRRWGLFIMKRRFKKKVKRIIFIKKYLTNRMSFKFKRRFKKKTKNKKKHISRLKIKIFRLKSIYINSKIKNKPIKTRIKPIKKAIIFYNNKFNKLRNFYMITKYLTTSKSYIKQEDDLTFKLVSEDFSGFNEIAANIKAKFNSLISSNLSVVTLDSQKKYENKRKLTRDKYLQYQKRYFSHRYFIYKRNKFKKKSHFKGRKQLKWLFFKRNKKKSRKARITRLKGVHFFVPSYLQIDFRTLTVIKMKSPTLKDRHYPFQISLPKTYTFYKSRGY